MEQSDEQLITDKKDRKELFNSIAKKYDFINHLLSFGCDKRWRKKAVKELRNIKNPVILDIATGTGDMAIALTALKPTVIHAVDISSKMLEIAYRKINKKSLLNSIYPKVANVEKLPFENNTFDAVTIAFGLRNFENKFEAMSEIYRVLKPGGKIVILELLMPHNHSIRTVYNFYFSKIATWIGGLISSDKNAYKYLYSSVNEFDDGNTVIILFYCTGIKIINCITLSSGIAGIFTGEKPLENMS